MTDINKKLKNFLNECDLEFKVFNHEETPTSVESALARESAGAPRSMGAKALIISTKKKVDGKKIYSFHMFVFEATDFVDGEIVAKKSNTEVIRNKLGPNRFANKEELADVAFGLVPGSIPPFGKPIFPKISSVFVDSALFSNDFVSFNAGRLTQSFLIRGRDYRKALGENYVVMN